MRFRVPTAAATLAAALALALLLSGCGLAALFGRPSPTASPTATPSATPTSFPSATPTPEPTPTPAPALDRTLDCTFQASSGVATIQNATDGNETTCWTSARLAAQTFEVEFPKDATIGGIYLQWVRIPSEWTLSVRTKNDEWVVLHDQGDDSFLNDYVAFDESYEAVRITANGSAQAVRLSELAVYSTGQLPEDVQVWKKPSTDLDLMVVTAHPDDEFLYMGGTLPYYAGELGRKVLVVYMTSYPEDRRSEALNALWVSGVTGYPVFCGFHDYKSFSLAAAKLHWNESEVVGFLVELLRRYKPKVAVSHDLAGEYGHGAHSLTAAWLLEAISYGPDASRFPASAKTFGTFQVQKCYLHLYAENPVVMDWNIPLERFGGRTALEMARESYAMNLSQLQYSPRVLDSGPYDCSRFGLTHSEVGQDVRKNDFFENVDLTGG